jgi:SAM-dependent methyltransferase
MPSGSVGCEALTLRPWKVSVTESQPPICDYEGSDYQARFWDQGGRDYEDQAEAVALSRLLPAKGDHLLEVGAGAGRNTVRYKGFRHITLLDYSRSQLEQAQARLGEGVRYRFVVGDVYRLPFAPGVFDGTTMIRTLHHMVQPLRALQQIRAVVARDGVLIMEYANKRNLKAIGRWVLGRQEWNPFHPDPIEFAALNFDFHPASVRRDLEAAGFKIKRQLTVSHFRLPILKRAIPLRVLVALDALMQWTGAWWQLSPSVFVNAQAVGEDEAAPAGAFWRCPVCSSLDLDKMPAGLRCTQCRRLWGRQGGIYNFREPLEG